MAETLPPKKLVCSSFTTFMFLLLFFPLKFVVAFSLEFCPLSLTYFSGVYSSSFDFFPSHKPIFLGFFLHGQIFFKTISLPAASHLIVYLFEAKAKLVRRKDFSVYLKGKYIDIRLKYSTSEARKTEQI